MTTTGPHGQTSHTLQAAHGDTALVQAQERAVQFRRWRADDVRSILATAGENIKVVSERLGHASVTITLTV